MADPGVLDLSVVEPAPLKVKLPDGELHDVVEPGNLGALGLQRFVARYRRAQELMSSTEATDQDAEEMLGLLVDCAHIAVPSAERETLGGLPLHALERLVEAFSVASPNAKAGTEKAPTLAS